MTKKQLKDRWKSKEFVDSLTFINNGKYDLTLLNNADLRGAKLIGKENILPDFPSLVSAKLSNVDFTYGEASVTIVDSEIDHFKFEDFKFDRSSTISKSLIKNTSFRTAKLILDFTDVIFENCDFTESIFKGGFKEWGFRRCKFYNCNFAEAYWKNTFLFACSFIDCTFRDFRIEKSLIRGFKVNILTHEVHSIFENCDEVTGLIQIEAD